MNEKTSPPVNINTFFTSSKAYFIGVNEYTSAAISNLNSPRNDIERLKQVLQEKHGFLVEAITAADEAQDGIGNEGNQRIIENPLFDPEDQEVLDFLKHIKVNKRERVLIYIACHGIAVNGDGEPEGYLLAKNSVPGDWATFIKMSTVMQQLNALQSDHLLVILDCCYSGAFRWAQQTRGIGLEVPKTIYYERFRQYVQAKAWQVMTSAAHDQLALDTMRLGNREEAGKALSPFAEILIDALENGSADLSYGSTPADGVITATELMFFIREQIFKHLYDRGIAVDKQQIPMLFSLGSANKGEFVFLSPQNLWNGKLQLKKQTNENPYKGLDAYTENDNVIFYGRERVLEGWEEGGVAWPGLKEVISNHPLTIVTGASGCGKTSLVKAGILSVYKKHGHQLRPGKTPYTSHADYLREIENAAEPKILLIDQYEELITVCNDEKEREDFEALILRLIKNHKVVITIRSDFESQFKTSKLFQLDEVLKSRFLVPLFLRSEIREIVEQPALQEVLEFSSIAGSQRANEAFINRIIDDAFQNPGSLPLLSLTLSELYERKDERKLLELEYNAFGGIGGILDVKVTAEYEKLTTDADRGLFKKLIFRLISLEGGKLAKRRIFIEAKNELPDELQYPSTALTQKIKEIASSLVLHRLLSSDTDENGQRFIEPVHDAFLRTSLILGWLKIRDPLQKLNNEDKIKLLYRISDISKIYNSSNVEERKGYLWAKDPRLELVAKELPDYLNVTEKVFIDDSIRLKRKSNQTARLLVAAALFAAFGTALFFWFQKERLQDQVNKTKALDLLTKSDTFTPTEAIRQLEYAYSLDSNSIPLQEKLSDLYAKSDREIAFSYKELSLDRPLLEYYPMGANVLLRYGKEWIVLLDSAGETLQSLSLNGEVLTSANQRFASFIDKKGQRQLLDAGRNILWQSKLAPGRAYPAFSADGQYLLLLGSPGTRMDDVAKLETVTIIDLYSKKELQIPIKEDLDFRYQGYKNVYYLPESEQLLVSARKNGREGHFIFDNKGNLQKTYNASLLSVNLNAHKILFAFPDRFEVLDYKNNNTRIIRELKPAGETWGQISDNGNRLAIAAAGNCMWMDLSRDHFFKRNSLDISEQIDSSRLTRDGKYLLSFTEKYLNRLDLQSGEQIRIAYSLAPPTEEYQRPATVSALSGDNYMVYNDNSQVLLDIQTGLAKKISSNNKQSKFAGYSGDTLMFISPNNLHLHWALKDQFGSCLSGFVNKENNPRLELLKEQRQLLVLGDQPNAGVVIDLSNNRIMNIVPETQNAAAFCLKDDSRKWYKASADGVCFYKKPARAVFYALKNKVETQREDLRNWAIHYSKKYGKAIAVPEVNRGVFIDLNHNNRLQPIRFIARHKYCFFYQDGFMVASNDSVSCFKYLSLNPVFLEEKRIKIPGNPDQNRTVFNDLYNDSTMVRFNSDSLTFQTITGKKLWTRRSANKKIDSIFYMGADHLAVSTSNKNGKTIAVLDRNGVVVTKLNFYGTMPESLRYDEPGGRLYYLKDNRLFVNYTHKAVLMAIRASSLPPLTEKQLE